MWVRHEGFADLVRGDWMAHTEATGLLNLKIKLARIKQTFKWWNKEVFGNIHANLKACEENIAVAQSEFEEEPSARNRMEINKQIAEYVLLLKMEEDFWRQKAALRWLEEGDKNTRFYQSWVKQKRIRLRIHKINANGRELTDDLEIKDSAVEFYQNLLAPTYPELAAPDLDLLQQLPPSEQLEDLPKPPDADEVKRVVFDISGSSAQGSDGFSALFYQACWGIVGPDVVDAVRQFSVWPSSPDVSRQQEMFHELGRCTPAPNVAIKIDMAKAYDRVQWPFLLKVLKQMGFPGPWIALIERCIGTCWFSTLINGSPAGVFKSTRGLRQGDPISPALFVLATDYLSRTLDRLILWHKEMTFKASRGSLEISHLVYANDIIIFTQPATTSLRRLYLGVLIYRGVKRSDMFMFLREKIAARISG
ncbi:uncharacterized protein LOC121776779 [Salvia splendens]|uniref:uncharacterized protein LOC121776779 n=1 Tax=Salvia splendens TaxID=180675 RepID=UPI001C25AB37|nr:uncharacterized protein LOC121776779 [Salvia splendens]